MTIEQKVASKLNISEETVHEVYTAYWSCVKDYIQSLPIKELNYDDLLKVKSTINIPKLGKLGLNLAKIKKVKDIINGREEICRKDNTET